MQPVRLAGRFEGLATVFRLEGQPAPKNAKIF
jgi:hypothetical protein